jgi:pimeloyl-ACP methyl ester carboxylesterase
VLLCVMPKFLSLLIHNSPTMRFISYVSYANFVTFFQVIGEPVYIVGNSLGGFVSLYLAASCPHLVKGVTLLNATPFWGFLPNPATSPRLSKIFPWAGTFPLPSFVRKLTETVYVLPFRFWETHVHIDIE